MKWLVAVMLYVVSVLVVLTCGSCVNRQSAKLAAVDKLSDVDNDSAVIILNSIDTTSLSVSDRAYYELLRTRFHYIRGNDPAFPDTLALWAQQELLRDGDPDNVFDVHFWNMNVYGRQGRFVSAMLEAEMAREILPHTTYPEDDKIILEAHLDKAVGNIWKLTGDNSLAMNYLHKADDGYSRAKRNDYIVGNQNNKLQIAIELSGDGHDKEALAILDSIKILNKDMEREVRFLSIAPLINIDSVERARGIAEELLREGMDSMALMPAMSEIALHDGNIPLAKRYADKFVSAGVITLQIINLYRKIAEREGDMAHALELQKEITRLGSGKVSHISSVELKEAIDRQNRQLMNENRLKAEHSRYVTLVVVILSLIAMILVTGGAILAVRKKKMRMDNLVMEIEELQNRDTEKASKISGLLTQRFESMNRLCDEYFNLGDLKNENIAKNEIYKTLLAQLKEMGSEKFRKKLEETLNENMDGLMDKFRESFPADKEAATLFIYFSSGFSAKAVGIFTGLKKSSVYSRRRQLRERIEQTDTPYREKFLLMLN